MHTTTLDIGKIDKELLEKQINALLQCNMPEEEKSGLHHLLGAIMDELEDNDE